MAKRKVVEDDPATEVDESLVADEPDVPAEPGEGDDAAAGDPPAVEEAPAVEKTALELAKEALAVAQAEHDAEVAKAAEDVEAVRVKAEYGKHVLVDVGKTGSYAMLEVGGKEGVPADWHNDRTLRLSGVNLEHVAEGEGGAWCYRAM